MTNECRNKIIKLGIRGTTKDKFICNKLLNENISFTKLSHFSNIFNIGCSTATRFWKRLGFQSWKHFLFSYNDIETKKESPNKLMNDFQKIIKSARGTIHIITSIRGKGLGKYVLERLHDGGINARYFHETKIGLDAFLNKSSYYKDTFVLISMDGHSLVIRQALYRLRAKGVLKILFTAKNDSPNMEDLFLISLLNEKKYDLERWKGYNNINLEMVSLITYFLNNLPKENLERIPIYQK